MLYVTDSSKLNFRQTILKQEKLTRKQAKHIYWASKERLPIFATSTIADVVVGQLTKKENVVTRISGMQDLSSVEIKHKQALVIQYDGPDAGDIVPEKIIYTLVILK